MPACFRSRVLVCGCQVYVFSLNGLDESDCGFWSTLVSNNRERTEDMTRDVAEGYEGVFSSLGYDHAMCLSGAV